MERRSLLAYVFPHPGREAVPAPASPAAIYQAARILRARIEAALAASRAESPSR